MGKKFRDKDGDYEAFKIIRELELEDSQEFKEYMEENLARRGLLIHTAQDWNMVSRSKYMKKGRFYEIQAGVLSSRMGEQVSWSTNWFSLKKFTL